jgi:hypothetical protein
VCRALRQNGSGIKIAMYNKIKPFDMMEKTFQNPFISIQ